MQQLKLVWNPKKKNPSKTYRKSRILKKAFALQRHSLFKTSEESHASGSMSVSPHASTTDASLCTHPFHGDWSWPHPASKRPDHQGHNAQAAQPTAACPSVRDDLSCTCCPHVHAAVYAACTPRYTKHQWGAGTGHPKERREQYKMVESHYSKILLPFAQLDEFWAQIQFK